MLLIAALVSTALLAVSAQTTDKAVIVSFDCKGGASVFPDTPLAVQSNADWLRRVVEAVEERLQARASCAAGRALTETEFSARWDVVNVLLSTLSGKPIPATIAGLDTGATAMRDISQLRRFFKATYRGGLPSTCTADTWTSSGTCGLKLDFPSIASQFNLLLVKCPSTNFPAVELSFTGNMKNFMSLCSSSTECGTGLKCWTLADLVDEEGLRSFFNSTGLSGASDSACGKFHTAVNGMYAKMTSWWRKVTGTPQGMCLPENVDFLTSDTTNFGFDDVTPVDAPVLSCNVERGIGTGTYKGVVVGGQACTPQDSASDMDYASFNWDSGCRESLKYEWDSERMRYNYSTYNVSDMYSYWNMYESAPYWGTCVRDKGDLASQCNSDTAVCAGTAPKATWPSPNVPETRVAGTGVCGCMFPRVGADCGQELSTESIQQMSVELYGSLLAGDVSSSTVNNLKNGAQFLALTSGGLGNEYFSTVLDFGCDGTFNLFGVKHKFTNAHALFQSIWETFNTVWTKSASSCQPGTVAQFQQNADIFLPLMFLNGLVAGGVAFDDWPSPAKKLFVGDDAPFASVTKLFAPDTLTANYWKTQGQAGVKWAGVKGVTDLIGAFSISAGMRQCDRTLTIPATRIELKSPDFVDAFALKRACLSNSDCTGTQVCRKLIDLWGLSGDDVIGKFVFGGMQYYDQCPASEFWFTKTDVLDVSGHQCSSTNHFNLDLKALLTRLNIQPKSDDLKFCFSNADISALGDAFKAAATTDDVAHVVRISGLESYTLPVAPAPGTPATPGTPQTSTTVVQLQLSIPVSFGYYQQAGEAEQTKFKDSVVKDIKTTANLPATAAVTIVDIRSGSIVVDYTVQVQGDTAAAATATAALDKGKPITMVNTVISLQSDLAVPQAQAQSALIASSTSTASYSSGNNNQSMAAGSVFVNGAFILVALLCSMVLL